MLNKKISASPISSTRKGILLVAFGSSTPVGNTTLAAFENHVRQCFPQTSIRWAFTSAHMRTRLTKARKKIDSVEKALKRMQFEKIGNIVVQPLHIIPGVEYDNLRQEVAAMNETSQINIVLGKPLLFNKKTIAKAADALLHHLPEKRREAEPVVCMGHGSWHRGSLGYAAFNRAIAEKDPHIFIGTLEGRQTIDVIIKKLTKNYPVNPAEYSWAEYPRAEQSESKQARAGHSGAEYFRDAVPANPSAPPQTKQVNSPSPRQRIWLLPLLSVIGHHALYDMAGDNPDSWKSRLEGAGYECMTVLKGTAEYEKFIHIWTEHIEEAMQKLPLAQD